MLSWLYFRNIMIHAKENGSVSRDLVSVTPVYQVVSRSVQIVLIMQINKNFETCLFMSILFI